MFKKSKLCTAALLALGGAAAFTSLPSYSQASQTVEVTGSRIKRVDSEGAMPVTVIDRAQLEASGTTTVAEFMRTVTFAAAGNFRPQSGSSAQSFAGIDLRGLGTSRTLVLIDGRRLPKAPNVGDSVDMNSVPMAIVERVEILTDGASAVYGSDAIGGVINFITRKDFEGVQLSAGTYRPTTEGGDKNEAYAIIGMSGPKGRILGGVSKTSRQMVYTSQRPWGQTRGASIYGNNFERLDDNGDAIAQRDAAGNEIMVPNAKKTALVPFVSPIGLPGGCGDKNFFEAPTTIAAVPALGFAALTYTPCRYNFNAVAADEASTANTAVFVRGTYEIDKDWSAYVNTSYSRLTSFGRYAPVPGYVVIDKTSTANPTFGTANPADVGLYHRFAAAGNRDTNIDNGVFGALVGIQGRVAGLVDLDFGYSKTTSHYNEIGRGYIVASIAEEKINSGEYDIYKPADNPLSVLQSITAQTGRDSLWDQKEIYGTASMELFKLAGGGAQLLVGVERRWEEYQDQYDSLSEAGQILGSAGNSAGGKRDVTSVLSELFLPVMKGLEVSLAARYEKYSDYGNDFAPKVSVRWKALPNLALRGSVGTGFRAPSLPVLTQKTSFSAESVDDPDSCAVLNPGNDNCQVNTYVQSNSKLGSEKSKQFSFGLVFDPLTWLSVKADYWTIDIKDTISYISAQDLVDRSNGTDSRPIPPGLGVTRSPNGVITRIDAGYANEGKLKTSGLDLSLVARYKLGAFGNLTQDYQFSQVLAYKVDGDEQIGTVGLPKARMTLGHIWSMGAFGATWNVNIIGKQSDSATRNVKQYTTHDLQVNWDTPIKGGRLVLGVQNLTNESPELVSYDGRNFNYYLYDSYGRTPYVRYTQKF